jgi:serine/threonine protein kinase
MTPVSLRVAGRYEILRLLGRGGMASVHLARQPALDREVALKELHPVHVKDPAFAHRFLNESRVSGALNHPSVVSVIEYFEHEDVPFIAMEYLERGSLRPLVGQLTLAQVAGVLDGVLGGLAEAASLGIVHRDLKPENLLVSGDGRVKIADFGIAKAIGQVCRTDFRTAEGQIVGTPAYMAPEQISSGEISPQVDLYATGLIAYELVAGRHPFDGTDAPMALLMHHVNSEPPPLADLRPDLAPGVAEWVHAMLAKEPRARPAGAVEAWDRLEGVVSDALGPRWRRDATLGDPPAAPVEVRTPTASERSGIFSLEVPAGPPAAGRHVVYYRSDPKRHEPEEAVAVDEDKAPRPRWLVLGVVLAAALLMAIALIL